MAAGQLLIGAEGVNAPAMSLTLCSLGIYRFVDSGCATLGLDGHCAVNGRQQSSHVLANPVRHVIQRIFS